MLVQLVKFPVSQVPTPSVPHPVLVQLVKFPVSQVPTPGVPHPVLDAHPQFGMEVAARPAGLRYPFSTFDHCRCYVFRPLQVLCLKPTTAGVMPFDHCRCYVVAEKKRTTRLFHDIQGTLWWGYGRKTSLAILKERKALPSRSNA